MREINSPTIHPRSIREINSPAIHQRSIREINFSTVYKGDKLPYHSILLTVIIMTVLVKACGKYLIVITTTHVHINKEPKVLFSYGQCLAKGERGKNVFVKTSMRAMVKIVCFVQKRKEKQRFFVGLLASSNLVSILHDVTF